MCVAAAGKLRRLLLRRQPFSPSVYGPTGATTIYYSSPPLLQQPEEEECFVCKNTHVSGWASYPFLQGFLTISLSTNGRAQRWGSRTAPHVAWPPPDPELPGGQRGAGKSVGLQAPGGHSPPAPQVTPGEQLRLESQDMDTDRQGMFKKRGRGCNCLEVGKRGPCGELQVSPGDGVRRVRRGAAGRGRHTGGRPRPV